MSSFASIPGLGSLIGKGAEAAKAAAGGGLPWSIILPIVFSGLSATGLFGGGEDEYEKWKREKEMQRLQNMFQPKYSAGEYQVNPAMFQGVNSAAYQAIMNHLKRMSNFGFPEGMTMDTSFIDQILANMPNYTATGGGYGGKTRLTSGR